MKLNPAALLAALAFGLALPAQAVEAIHAHPGHEQAGAQELQLNAGKKWETDAALRQAMGNINQAMAAAVPRIHGKRFGEADYQALAATVNKEIAYAVENCRLDARADAMLHLVIGDLAAGAEAMAGKAAASRHAGAATVLRALQDYGRHFDHPG